MKLHKKILAISWARGLLCLTAAMLVRAINATLKWQILQGDIPEQYWRQDRPFILCFWHGRMLLMPFAWKGRMAVQMLVSQHLDGQAGAQAMAHLGIGSIDGSTGKSGGAGLRAMVRTLRAGTCVAIAPDGPRGPRMRAGLGAVTLARITGMPIVPCAVASTRRRMLRSWDRFCIALPFGRAIAAWGAPIQVAKDADDETQEAARMALEGALNGLSRRVDLASGHVPIEAAEAAP